MNVNRYEQPLTNLQTPPQVVDQSGGGAGSTALADTGSGGTSGGYTGMSVSDIMSQFSTTTAEVSLTDPMIEAFAKLGKYQLGLSEDEINSIFADPEQKAAAMQMVRDQIGKGGLVDDVLNYAKAGWSLDQITGALLPTFAKSQEGEYNTQYGAAYDKMVAPLTGTFNTAYDPLIEGIRGREKLINDSTANQSKTIGDTYDYLEITLRNKLESAKNNKDLEEARMDRETADFLAELNRTRDAKVRDLEIQNKQVSDSYNYAVVDAKEAQKAMWKQQRNVFGNLGIMGSSEFMQAKAGADVKFNISLQKLHSEKINAITQIENAKQDTYDRVMNMTKEMNNKVLSAQEKLNEWYRSTSAEIEAQQEYSAIEKMNKLTALEDQRLANIAEIRTMADSLVKEKTLGLYSATREAEANANARALQMAQMSLSDYNNDIMALITQAAGPTVSQSQIAAATAANNWEMQQFLMNYNLQVSQSSGGSGSYSSSSSTGETDVLKQAYLDSTIIAPDLYEEMRNNQDYNSAIGVVNQLYETRPEGSMYWDTLANFVNNSFDNGVFNPVKAGENFQWKFGNVAPLQPVS